jgi:hypothetical protein
MSRADLAKQFEDVFTRLLAGESDEPHAMTLSDSFEVMANTLLPHRGGAFDGVSPMWVKRRSPRKLEFIGDMHVLGGHHVKPLEPLRATAVDKRITKQGIWIQLWISDDHAEAELSKALGVCEAEV